MTLNGIMAVSLRYFTEFGSFKQGHLQRRAKANCLRFVPGENTDHQRGIFLNLYIFQTSVMALFAWCKFGIAYGK